MYTAVLLKLAEQIPLALLVAGLAYVIMRLFMRQQERRDAERDRALQSILSEQREVNSSRDEAFRTGMAVQNELMRKFWDSQQSNNRDVLERLVRGVETMMGMLQRHDQKTDIAIATMYERTGDDAPDGLNVPTKPKRGGDD